MIDFSKTPPEAPSGFPLDHTYFTGGRTGLVMAKHGGIIDLFHYARQPLAGASFFESSFPHSAWVKVFRLAVVIDGVAYYPEFNKTKIYPFGCTAECSMKGVRVAYQILLLNDALVQRVLVLSNPSGRHIHLKAVFNGFAQSKQAFRSWSPWKADPQSSGLIACAKDKVSEEEGRKQVTERKKDPVQFTTFEIPDVAKAETCVGIGSTCGVELSKMDGAQEGFKYYVTTGRFNKEASFFVCFHPTAAGIRSRVLQLASTAPSECDSLLASYGNRLEKAPKIKAESSVFRSCMENLPPLIESLKIKDTSGAIRAAVNKYYIWGWDSIVYADAYLFANDAPFLRDALLFLKDRADQKLGIPHQFTTRLAPQMAMAFPIQCLYISALYNYYCHTGDQKTLQQCYPLASWIIRQCFGKEVQGTGLVEGVSLYPDFPGLLDQNGKDISVFNNSVFYQGLLCMRYLASEMHAMTSSKEDLDLSHYCSEFSKKTRSSFLRHFYDEDSGYFVDSVSSEDFSRRKYYPVYAILWVTRFAADLLGGNEKRIASFMARNFTRPHGLGMFPAWDPAYMRDGNQFGAYYPVVETLYRNVMKLAGRGKELRQWISNVEWFWTRHTIPEGHTYDAENEGLDNPGTKPLFAIKGWYDLFFRTILGIEVDERGLVITPGPAGFEATVTNVPVRGKSLDVQLAGSGPGVSATLNGVAIRQFPHVVAFSHMKQKNTLLIKRSGWRKKKNL